MTEIKQCTDEKLKDVHISIQSCKTLGMDKCLRCWNWSYIPYPLKLCNRCVEVLRNDYPDDYEEAKKENMRLYDEKFLNLNQKENNGTTKV
jgi:hypothetical protein